MKRPLLVGAAGLVIGCAAVPATAGEAFLGVYAHDIDDQISHGHYEEGPQIVGGFRTTALDELKVIGRPRVHVLAGVNTRGGTNYAAAGLSWRLPVGEAFYIEPGVGIAVNDGAVNLPSPLEAGLTAAERRRRQSDWDTRLDLGSRVTFEPEISFGWRVSDRLSAEVSWIHLSHAQLAGPQNPGLGDVGVRLVYRYGVDRGSRLRR